MEEGAVGPKEQGLLSVEGHESENSAIDRENSKLLLFSARNRLLGKSKNPGFDENLQLARMYFEDGEPEKAVQIARGLKGKESQQGEDKEMDLLRLSELEYDLKMTSEAKELLDKVFLKIPSDPAFSSGWSIYSGTNMMDLLARVAVKEGRQEELIQIYSEAERRDNIYLQIGWQLIAIGEVDQAKSLLDKMSFIENYGFKLALGKEVIFGLIKNGRREEALELTGVMEEQNSPCDLAYSRRVFLSIYLLENRPDKVEEMLGLFEEVLNRSVLSSFPFKDIFYIHSARDYAGALILAGRFEKARSVISSLENKIAEVLAKDSEELNDDNKYAASEARSDVIHFYTSLGDYDKAAQVSAASNLSYVYQNAEVAEAMIEKGEVQRGVSLVQEAIKYHLPVFSSGEEMIYNTDWFKFANILADNGYLFQASGYLSKASEGHHQRPAAFCRNLSRLIRKHFPKGEEPGVNFALLAPRFVVNGETNWEIVEQAGLVVNAESVNTVINLLPAGDRERALTLIQRTALHYGTDYARESKTEIFNRAKALLVSQLENGNESFNEREKVKILVDILVNIGDKEARDLLLSLTQEQISRTSEERPESSTFRLIKALAELNTNRGNDFLFDVLGDDRLGYHESLYLLGKLAANKYISEDILVWLKERDHKRQELFPGISKAEYSAADVKVIKLLIKGAHLNPSKEILDLLAGEEVNTDPAVLISLVERKLKEVEKSRSEIETANSAEDLVAKLCRNKEKAIYFYILNKGKTRFDLINNYSFEKFWEVISIINGLKVHEGPIAEFDAALANVNFSEVERSMIIANLRLGHNLFYSAEHPFMERIVRLDVTDSEKYESAVREIGDVFGKDQVGVCLKSTFYRRYLSELGDEASILLLKALNKSANLPERQTVIARIEEASPQFLNRIIEELGPTWDSLEKKMSFGGVSAESLLSNGSNNVNAEAVIVKIEEKREELKSAKKSLIAALKNENPQIAAANREISRKRKAVGGLRKGLERNPGLSDQITNIEREIEVLESQIEQIGLTSLESRYATLSPEQKKQKIEEETRELQALTDKDPSMVLMYLIAEIAGESNLIENDISVIKETGSHLEGPIQMVVDLAKLDRSGGTQKVERAVRVRMLDKKDDLMTMVRFADSKICCFSSSNYGMRVAHNAENKQWVSSINKDPLSFVFEIEDASEEGKEAQTRNLGFVFGMFGISGDGAPEVMLNGVYYSGGNDINSVASIAKAIEIMLSQKIHARHQFVASMYGGSIGGDLPDYSNQALSAKRLRAIDDGSGNPETKVYDDLGTIINTTMDFKDKVWHKELPLVEKKEEMPVVVEEMTRPEETITKQAAVEEVAPIVPIEDTRLPLRERIRMFLRSRR